MKHQYSDLLTRKNEAKRRMIDALQSVLINQKFFEAEIDPLGWDINIYYTNRLIYEDAADRLEQLGYNGGYNNEEV